VPSGTLIVDNGRVLADTTSVSGAYRPLALVVSRPTGDVTNAGAAWYSADPAAVTVSSGRVTVGGAQANATGSPLTCGDGIEVEPPSAGPSEAPSEEVPSDLPSEITPSVIESTVPPTTEAPVVPTTTPDPDDDQDEPDNPPATTVRPPTTTTRPPAPSPSPSRPSPRPSPSSASPSSPAPSDNDPSPPVIGRN
jgi:putative peptide zinc metalloprotease protein